MKPHICLIKRLRKGQCSIQTNKSVEFKRRRQVSREAGFSKSVEVEQFFVTRPAILLEGHGITTTCREYSAMRDDVAAEAKGVVEDNTIFGPIHNAMISSQYGLCGIEVQIDSVSGDGSKSLVVISRGLHRSNTEITAGCKQSMHPETATQQDASPSSEKSVADVSSATRSKVKSPPSSSPEKDQWRFRLKNWKWRHIPCVGVSSKGSFEISSREVKVLRHSPAFGESDGAFPWTSLMYRCK